VRTIGAGGFTLIELLVVLTVIALGTAVVLPRLIIRPKGPKPEVVTFLERQRARAITQGRTVQVWGGAQGFDADDEIADAAPNVSRQADRHFDLPRDTRLIALKPPPPAYADRALIAVFYPDGTSIAGAFDLVEKTAPGLTEPRLHIDITPMQGEIIHAQR